MAYVSTATRSRRFRARDRGLADRLAVTAFVVLGVAAAALVVVQTQGTTFIFDEWEWIANRRGNSVAAFLDPYNGHLSVLPIAIYRVEWAIFGLRTYVPERALLLGAELLVAALVYAYARARVAPVVALAAGASLLFLGPAWNNLLFGFQLAWEIALIGGVGALLALDRDRPASDALACLLLMVALAAQSVALVFLLVAAIDVLGRPDRVRRLWIIAVPVVLYAAWWIGWQTPTATSTLRAVLEILGRFLSADAADLFGLGGHVVPDDQGTILDFGPPLLAILGLTMAWRALRAGREADRLRLGALVLALVALGVLIGLARTELAHGDESRYVAAGIVLLVLALLEAFAGARVPAWAGAVLAAVTVAAIVSNLATFRAGGAYLRDVSQGTRSDLAALDIAHPELAARPAYVAVYLPGWPFILLRAERYYAASRALGTPAASAAQLATEPSPDRTIADDELVRAERIRITPAAAARPGAGCETATGVLSGTVPHGGVRLLGHATVSVRRFGPAWVRIGVVRGAGRIDPPRDLATAPWRVRLAGRGRLVVCPAAN